MGNGKIVTATVAIHEGVLDMAPDAAARLLAGKLLESATPGFAKAFGELWLERQIRQSRQAKEKSLARWWETRGRLRFGA
jgi:hypothetical protein